MNAQSEQLDLERYLEQHPNPSGLPAGAEELAPQPTEEEHTEDRGAEATTEE